MALENAQGIRAIWDNQDFVRGVNEYQTKLKESEGSTTRAADVLTRLGSIASTAVAVGLGAAAVAAGAFAAASKVGLDSAARWGEKLDNLGDQFGMNAKEASGWAFLMEKMGVSVEEGAGQLNYFTKNLNDVKKAGPAFVWAQDKSSDAVDKLKQKLEDARTRLTRAQKAMAESKKPTDTMRYAIDDARKSVERLEDELANATSLVKKEAKGAAKEITPFQQALEKLGVSAFDSKGKLKTFDQIMPQIMDKFSKLPAGVNATALAMDLFGARGGSKFLDLLRSGSAGLADATAKAKALGLAFTDDGVSALDNFAKSQKELGLGLEGLKSTLGLAVLPVVTDLVNAINKNVLPAFGTWAQEHAPAITKALQSLSDWVKTNLLPVFAQIADAIKTGDFGKLADTVGDILKKVVGAATKYLNDHWDDISKELVKWAGKFWDWITGTPSGLLTQVADRVGKVVNEIAKEITKQWPTIQTALFGWITQFWNWITDPKSGLLVTVVDNMTKLTKSIADWSKSPATRTALQNIGKDVANAIIDAMGGVFESKDTGGNLISKIASGIKAAMDNLTEAISNILASVASGIVLAIAGRFTDEENAQKVANKFADLLQGMIKNILAPGGPIIGLAVALKDLITQMFDDAIALILGGKKTFGDVRGIGVGTSLSGPMGGAGGSTSFSHSQTVNQSFVLNMNNSLPVSTVVQDFGLLRSLART